MGILSLLANLLAHEPHEICQLETPSDLDETRGMNHEARLAQNIPYCLLLTPYSLLYYYALHIHNEQKFRSPPINKNLLCSDEVNIIVDCTIISSVRPHTHYCY